MSWEDATHIWAEQSGPDDGFYVQVRAVVSLEDFTHSLTHPFDAYTSSYTLNCFDVTRYGITRK